MVVGEATRIQLCGRLIVELQGRRLEDTLRGRQGRLLFAYLALHRDRPVRRDELAEALWSGKGAPARLRVAARAAALAPAQGARPGRARRPLRAAADPARGRLDRLGGRARASSARARERVDAGDGGVGRRRRRVEIAERGLLPGLEAPWIDAHRGELADLRVEALETLAPAGAQLGGAAWPEAEQAARAAVAGPAVPRVGPRRADGGPARARQRQRGAARLRGRPRAAARGARQLARRRARRPARAAAARRARRRARARAAPRGRPPKPSATLVERDREVALLDTLLARGDRGGGPRGADRGPARDRQVAPAGRVPPPRDRRRRARAQRPRGRARARVPVRRRPPALRGRRRRPDGAGRRRRAPRASSSPRPTTARPAGDASFAALHGLYWLALNLAAERPLLLEVDDLHWCDRPSLRFLAYLVRRLEGQPVLVTASVRTGDPPTDAALLAEIANDPATAHVRPGPLSEEAVGELVAAPARRRARPRLPRGLPQHHRRQPAARPPAAERARDRRASSPTPRTPTSCARSARARSRARSCCGSRACPARPPTVARAVAVLGEGADLPAVAGVAGLDEAQVAGTMAALARAEILRPEPPPGFVHPLVRDAVYQGLPLGERELLHARAAGVLRDGRRLAGPGRRPAHAHAAARRRRGRPAAARGRQRRAGARRRSTTRPATCGARSRSRRRPTDRPQLLLDLGQVEALTRGPDGGARTCARPTTGSTDVAPARARRQRARPRAAVHLLARRGRRGRPRGRARPAAGAGGRGARPRGLRADGRAVRRARPGGDASRATSTATGR